MTQLGPSIIRTIVPWIVGMVLTFAADHLPGLTIPEGIATAVMTTVVSGVYYGLVRIAETRLSPLWGWLIGSPKQPTYAAPAAPAATSPTGFEATQDAPGIPEGTPVDVEPTARTVSTTYPRQGGDSKADATYHDGR